MADARIRWHSPPPTSVDEELVVTEDGTGVLVVRTARDGTPAIGTWTAAVTVDDLAVLVGQSREIDVTQPPVDDEVVRLAERIAAAARRHPLATATFHAASLPGGEVALQAVGGGESAADFQLAADSVVVHLERDGVEVAWWPMDRLLTGFVSPEPTGLGGVGRPAEIRPGLYGTIALSGPAMSGPGEVAVEVRGLLRGEAGDESGARGYRPFLVRTAPVPLPDGPP